MRIDEDAENRATALAAVAHALYLDGLAREVLNGMRASGIPVVLMKGPVVAQWLYRSGELRTYGDVDILVDPARLTDARRVVAALADWESVDLHDLIPGVGAHPVPAFERLFAHTELTSIAGVEARVLDEVGRTLHVALHAGWHGPTKHTPLRDLDLAVELVDRAAWRAAVRLARDVAALPSFVVGLEQTESGRALRCELGLPKLDTMRARIGFDEASVPAKRLAELDLADGWRAKARVVRSIAFPSRFEMNRRYPVNTPGNLPLVRIHRRRVGRRLRELPSAIRLLRRMR